MNPNNYNDRCPVCGCQIVDNACRECFIRDNSEGLVNEYFEEKYKA